MVDLLSWCNAKNHNPNVVDDDEETRSSAASSEQGSLQPDACQFCNDDLSLRFRILQFSSE